MKNKCTLLTIAAFQIVLWSYTSTLLFAGDESTVLERVKKIEDPDLSSLIQIATEKEWPKETNKAKLIQIITEQYAQIKLLDEKIKQLNKRIDEFKNPKEIEYELILAKSSLETERLTKLSQLRETLNLIPSYPFGFKDTKEINTWICLEIYDNDVRFFNFIKPFYENLTSNSDNTHAILKSEEAIKRIKTSLEQKNAYPLRISIFFVSKTKESAENLRIEIQNLIKKQNIEYEVDMPNIKLLTPHTTNMFLLPERYISENDSMQQTSSLLNRCESIDRFVRYQEQGLKYPSRLPLVYKIRNYSGPCQTLPPEEAKTRLSEFRTNVISELRNMISRLGYENYITIEEN